MIWLNTPSQITKSNNVCHILAINSTIPKTSVVHKPPKVSIEQALRFANVDPQIMVWDQSFGGHFPSAISFLLWICNESYITHGLKVWWYNSCRAIAWSILCINVKEGIIISNLDDALPRYMLGTKSLLSLVHHGYLNCIQDQLHVMGWHRRAL